MSSICLTHRVIIDKRQNTVEHVFMPVTIALPLCTRKLNFKIKFNPLPFHTKVNFYTTGNWSVSYTNLHNEVSQMFLELRDVLIKADQTFDEHSNLSTTTHHQ